MQDPADLQRVVHVPRFVRVVLGLLILLFGLAFLLLVGSMLFLGGRKRDLVLESVLILMFPLIGLTCVYVGFRLIVLRADREPLVRPHASRALSAGLAATGVAALAATLIGSEPRTLYASIAVVFLPIAWFVHTRHTDKAAGQGR